MEQIPVYLNENLTISNIYYLRQVFYLRHPRSVSQVWFNAYLTSGSFKTDWNNVNKHRFKIIEMSKDGEYIVIRGTSENAESFDELNMDLFFKLAHGWIIACSDVNAYYLGEIEASEQGEDILKEEETRKAFKIITIVIVIIVILITLYYMTPKVWKKLRGKK